MTQNNTGGPAFPQSETLYEDGAELARTQHGGMTLRDWFAGQALAGCAARWIIDQKADDGTVSDWAYEIADAMIAVRNGGQDT